MTFTGTMSGDCECFCWDDVAQEVVNIVNGEPDELDTPGRLYTTDILRRLGFETGDRVKVTIIVEKE